MYGMSRCLRNSVRLRTCTGRWAIKFLGSASSATALVLRGYCYCIGTFTKMSTEIGDKKMNNINGGNTASKSSGKDMWGALEAKFGVSDAGSELYVMEQFYDYKMVDDRSIVEQAHEIQMLVKELENNNCELPDKFVVGGIIAKLPPSWSDFATSLKHKRQEFSVTDLIGSLGIEEKARAKDNWGKKIEGGSSANLVQKNNNKKVKPDVKPKGYNQF
uniref:Gag and Pol protein, putative n=2 Tax=Oryza sativa subsp. japonica TaxID=39947 RepID=Q10FE1_ORYSJ|nr:putative gag-pol polyprotein [Oryza sativa Japonica Group]AAT85294.1 Gag and Pol protein, putative [Oryza sativa Japonica Group]ABF98121.1 retrotransposon protein, putative, Ty1-copia subclass, expressed [Oryza sativa Japonica Group]